MNWDCLKDWNMKTCRFCFCTEVYSKLTIPYYALFIAITKKWIWNSDRDGDANLHVQPQDEMSRRVALAGNVLVTVQARHSDWILNTGF